MFLSSRLLLLPPPVNERTSQRTNKAMNSGVRSTPRRRLFNCTRRGTERTLLSHFSLSNAPPPPHLLLLLLRTRLDPTGVAVGTENRERRKKKEKAVAAAAVEEPTSGCFLGSLNDGSVRSGVSTISFGLHLKLNDDERARFG